MKRIILVLIFCMINLLSNAQLYQLNQSISSYNEINNSISVNNGNVWSNIGWNGWRIPIGFSFKFFNLNFDSVYVSNGIVYFNKPYFEGKLIIQVFSGSNAILKDRGTTNSLSPISYQLNISGQKILKIQWKNAGFIYGNPSDSVNVQLWLYETTNCIEMHIGSNSISTNTYNGEPGPSIGLYTEGHGFYFVSGEPSNVVLSTTSTFLNSTPQNGVVYKFCLNSSDIELINFDNQNIIYPNFTSDFINVNTKYIISDKISIEIINIMGSTVLKSTVPKNDLIEINVKELSSGFYILKINSVDIQMNKKFYKR